MVLALLALILDGWIEAQAGHCCPDLVTNLPVNVGKWDRQGQGAGLLFRAHVNLFHRLKRGELAILEAAQTLFHLGH
ncbi:hypothetical protein CRG98_002354 [Punica granatum]|uniref:Secreted protein n=1 Tax=Punica granatum TaxID=22663 RepID=A0A2I0L9A3_PUNGR|nr:hypothetical protein CRG98_002354 [Punica granatum]